MRKYWYRRILIIVLVFTVSVGGSYYLIKYQENVLKREVSAKTSDEMVIPGGMPIGIYMETEGALVLGTEKIKGIDGIEYEPAAHLVKEGDYIVCFNETKIENKKDLVEAVRKLTEKEVVIQVRREDKFIDIMIDAVEYEQEKYKLGIWVKDNAQGLGTITYLKSDSTFGALGHGIHDTDTEELLEITEGTIYETNIIGVQKGKKGEPGGLEGVIIYNHYNILGTVEKNTEKKICLVVY